MAAALALDRNTARIEVQSLLQHVLNVSRVYLLAHPERCLAGQEQNSYDKLLRRRLQGEPLAYILGVREFFGLPFKVTPATLIPRPETELLVELSLRRIPSPPDSIPQMEGSGRSIGRRNKFRVLDLGTGSGAIALSIAHARPDVEVVASEASEPALVVARENARQLNVANVVFESGNWFESLEMQMFDLIVSNPPYVATSDPHLLQGDLRFEPPAALASGVDGLEDIRHIISKTPLYLNPGGWLMVEHGYEQAAMARNLLREAGLVEVFSTRDMAGIERVSGGRLLEVQIA